MGGGGYFTRIFRNVVGAKGHVCAVIPESLAAKAPPEKFNAIHALLADPTYKGNISHRRESRERSLSRFPNVCNEIVFLRIPAVPVSTHEFGEDRRLLLERG